MMTGGQTTMAFSMEGDSQQQNDTGIQRIVRQSSNYALFSPLMKS